MDRLADLESQKRRAFEQPVRTSTSLNDCKGQMKHTDSASVGLSTLLVTVNIDSNRQAVRDKVPFNVLTPCLV